MNPEMWLMPFLHYYVSINQKGLKEYDKKS